MIIQSEKTDIGNLIYKTSADLLMGSFTLHGKIISKEKKPLGNLKVYAYDHDPILKPDDFLGDSPTDQDGFLESILTKLNSRDFGNLWMKHLMYIF